MRRFEIGAYACLALLLDQALPAQTAPPEGLVPSLGTTKAAPATPRTYGTTTEIAHPVSGFDFEPVQGSVLVSSGGGARVCGGPCGLLAGLRVPAGSLVSRIELEGCDSSPTEQLQFALYRRPSPSGILGVVGGLLAGTGGSETPGCGFFSRTFPTPETIDNENNLYFLGAFSNSGVTFFAVRVYYQLQVSTAPALATFPNDVPTAHPYFRFIEALAASGITAGCAPGSFCPNSPISRGEMAVFLAAALGLHFAP